MSPSRYTAALIVPLCMAALAATPASAATLAPTPVTVTAKVVTAPEKTPAVSAPVVVPAEAVWAIETPTITVVANPKPVVVPEPEPARERPAASRSQDRAPLPEPPAPAPAPAPPAASGSIIDIAAQYVGVPYVSGGASPDGFDCSGFTQYVFAQAGISLPRTSSDQRYAGTVVSRDQAQPGDLIWSPGHISIYAGGNKQIDSPKPGKTVQFRDIWQSDPVFIRVG